MIRYVKFVIITAWQYFLPIHRETKMSDTILDTEESLNLLLIAVEYYEMNHDTGEEESTERHKANVWKAYNNIKEGVTE